MNDTEIYNFIDNNKLDAIEGVLVTLNNDFQDNPSYKQNEFVITFLLKQYFNDNKCADKLEFFLSDISTINFLKDKDIFGFVISLVNTNNKYELNFNDQFESIKLLLETSKAYLDTKRSNYYVLDNIFLSELINLYANFPSEMNKDIRELFFLALYNNYGDIEIKDSNNFDFILSRIYNEFLKDDYFKTYDIEKKEILYQDIVKYLEENLSYLVKPKVK